MHASERLTRMDKNMGKKKGHDAHLCSLMGCEELGDIVPLVVDARYICGRCGRAARKKKNLCKPGKISGYVKG